MPLFDDDEVEELDDPVGDLFGDLFAPMGDAHDLGQTTTGEHDSPESAVVEHVPASEVVIDDAATVDHLDDLFAGTDLSNDAWGTP